MKFWIARDLTFNGLFLYKEKPVLDGDIWFSDDYPYTIDNLLFPEITFENSPQEVEFVIKK